MGIDAALQNRRLRHALLAVLPAGLLSTGQHSSPAADGPRPWRLQPDTAAVREAAYARAITVLADGAIRQLDLLPTRAQLRVQGAFLDPARAAGVRFDDLARRGQAAADAADAAAERFGAVAPPADLAGLHRELTASLNEARTALDRMAAAAAACAGDARSLQRCQVPFTTASDALSRAYRRYLDVRRRVGNQVTDTGTILPAFGRADRAPDEKQGPPG